jgi:hypothetical protein
MSELPAGWRVIPLGTLLRAIEAGQIRAVVGPIASERVGLDGNGLKLVVHWCGERSTAAIESLKVIALDLAHDAHEHGRRDTLVRIPAARQPRAR